MWRIAGAFVKGDGAVCMRPVGLFFQELVSFNDAGGLCPADFLRAEKQVGAVGQRCGQCAGMKGGQLAGLDIGQEGRFGHGQPAGAGQQPAADFIEAHDGALLGGRIHQLGVHVRRARASKVEATMQHRAGIALGIIHPLIGKV